MPRDAVLDASAALVLLQGEARADRVAACIPGGPIRSVHLAEVVARLADAGMPREQVELALSSPGLRVVPLDGATAFAVGVMRPATRALGLSLGDRACLALGVQVGLPVLTADPAWVALDPGAGVEAIREGPGAGGRDEEGRQGPGSVAAVVGDGGRYWI